MKETVIYDVELIETVLNILDGRIIPQMTFKGSDDVLIVSDMIHALREQGRIQKAENTAETKTDKTASDVKNKSS